MKNCPSVVARRRFAAALHHVRMITDQRWRSRDNAAAVLRLHGLVNFWQQAQHLAVHAGAIA
jgi:hypothetical protein